MEAITFNSATKSLDYSKTFPVPDVNNAPDSVLVKVAYAGICGTDLHIIQGEFPCKRDGPVVLGHELSGIVSKVGRNVDTVVPGDRVSVDPNSGCNKCEHCHRGNPHFCSRGGLDNTIGIYRNGGWAQFVLVPENQVHKLPESVALGPGALCEPLSCLSHGWDKIAPIHLGRKILVLGSGIIGNLWICALHLHGHRRVTVSEPNKSRRALVERMDTRYELLSPSELEARAKKDEGYRFDFVVDCSGFPGAIEKAVDLLNPGGTLCLFGVASPEAEVKLRPYEVFRKEISIVGIKINPFSFPNAMGLAEALGDRYLTYDNLGIKEFALSQYQEALCTLKSGEISKAVFKF